MITTAITIFLGISGAFTFALVAAAVLGARRVTAGEAAELSANFETADRPAAPSFVPAFGH